MSSTPQTDPPRDSLAVPRPKRPVTSRTHSRTSVISVGSTASHPRRQNQDYFPTEAGAFGGDPGQGDDGVSRWLYDEDTEITEADHTEDVESEGGSESEQEEDERSIHDQEWEMARIGSIARRSVWRKPKPVWIYPFIIAATLCMGMGSAPRSELYINLACLSHPPRQPSSMDTFANGVPGEMPVAPIPGQIPWTDDLRGNVSVPSARPQPPRTAADEWFLRMQHDMYQWKLEHQSPDTGGAATSSSGTGPTSTALPSGPIPHPTDTPIPGQNQTEPGGGQETSPIGNRPPFHAIDPALCKRDVKVQAAAARLTMSAQTSLASR